MIFPLQSMTLIWSKVVEIFLVEFTLLGTGKNQKNSQHGGWKGSSTDHILVDIWNKILTDLNWTLLQSGHKQPSLAFFQKKIPAVRTKKY